MPRRRQAIALFSNGYFYHSNFDMSIFVKNYKQGGQRQSQVKFSRRPVTTLL